MWFMPGRKVTVSLTDGSALSGVTKFAWPGKLRLVDVRTINAAEVPGEVYVPARAVLTVQVMR